jgi:hypothetical protein
MQYYFSADAAYCIAKSFLLFVSLQKSAAQQRVMFCFYHAFSVPSVCQFYVQIIKANTVQCNLQLFTLA